MTSTLKKGPLGGIYYVTSNGHRCYVDRSSWIKQSGRFDSPVKVSGFLRFIEKKAFMPVVLSGFAIWILSW